MASAFGENRGMVCAVCGLRYDDLRTGRSFKELRREIITIGTDTKTGKTKYGRRSGVLGYAHELKMMLWDAHVGECLDGLDRAVAAGTADAFVEGAVDARKQLIEEQRLARAARLVVTKKAFKLKQRSKSWPKNSGTDTAGSTTRKSRGSKPTDRRPSGSSPSSTGKRSSKSSKSKPRVRWATSTPYSVR